MYDNLEILAVGQPSKRVELLLERMAADGDTTNEGCLFDVRSDGLIIVEHVMYRASKEEQNALKSGPLKLSVGEVNGIIFLVLEYSGGNCEMFYAPGLLPIADRPKLCVKELAADKELRLLASYHLYDSQNMQVKALRSFTLTNEMSVVLSGLIMTQSVNAEVLDRNEYVACVREVQVNFTVKELVAKALASTVWRDGKESGGSA